MYIVYLDGEAMPVTPQKINIKIQNQNKTIDLADGTQLNILNAAGLTEIEFDLLIPQVRYPFAHYPTGFHHAEHYLKKLEALKTGKKTFRFICTRVAPSKKRFHDTNMLVSLEEYEMTEDAKEGMDVSVSVTLKQYIPVAIRTIVLPPAPKPVPMTQKDRDAPASQGRTYTVVRGDSLWDITQKCWGAGSRYKEMYALNQEMMDARNAAEGTSKYTIYTGQVMRLE